jgi:hypothetical protein
MDTFPLKPKVSNGVHNRNARPWLKSLPTSKPLKSFSAAEGREAIVTMVSTDPECGDLIQGTGGFRKVRVGRGGMGKRGGARVIYILRNEGFPVFLVTAYAKNERVNLTKAERNELAKMADGIFNKYGR